MAITVAFNPNVPTFLYGDAPITVSMSGTPLTGWAGYFWESDNGVFTDRFAATTTFTPYNASKVSTIIGRRTKNFLTGLVTPGNFTAYNNGWQKTGGSNTTWETANTDGPLSSGGFIEFEVRETTAEKAVGLSANSAYGDPNLTGTNSFLLNWHFFPNGTAVPRKQGGILADPIFYSVGDTFRVAIEGTAAVFYANGIRVVSTTIPSGSLYGVAAFRNVGAIVDNPRTFTDTVNNQGVKTLTVYGLFPEQPNYSYELNKDNKTLVSFAEDGSATSRVKGGIKRNLNLNFVERPFEEYVSLNDFWQRHQKHLSFFYRDLVLGTTTLMVFDSGLKITVVNPNTITITCVLREV